MAATPLVHDAPRVVRASVGPEPLERVGRSYPVTFSLSLAMLLIVGDLLTGVELAFTLLYLLPIAFAAWWRGRAVATAIGAVCVGGAVAVELITLTHRHRPLHVGHILWNQGGSFAIFVLCAWLVARLRAYADKDRRERRVTATQLRQTERLGVVGKLAAGLAHELGTPLSVVLGYAEVLGEERSTPAARKAASEIIIAQTAKMTTILRGLLDFSRRGGGERTAIDVGALLRDAAALIQPTARKKDVGIELEAPGAMLVLGNRTELEQVLVNLMMNGIHAMKDVKKGGTLRLRALRTKAPGGDSREVCLEVEDNGSGISREDLPLVFDPFFTTKEVGEGTGLGLSVSYGIVSEHGGRIQVTSTPGVGSCFSVHLPLAGGAP